MASEIVTYVHPGPSVHCVCFQVLRTVFIAELHSIQTDPRYNDTSITGPVSTLSIVETRADPTKFIQEYTESSALGGFATVGGLWTFINGAFALFFGANMLYFGFGTRNTFYLWEGLNISTGRRPLSALRIVHIFQRRQLVRKWNEDFPALRTEGGRPGSEDAGIVAFLRERLVDLEDDDNTAREMDLEAKHQRPNIRCAELSDLGPAHDAELIGKRTTHDDNASVHSNDTSWTSNSMSKRGYSLDEISLIDEDRR
jgi:hypothetical protein